MVESAAKRKILVKEKLVLLNDKSFKSAEDEDSLLVELIINNSVEYFENKGNYTISDGIRGLLLMENLNIKQKYDICQDISGEGIEENLNLCKNMIEVLATDNIDCSGMDKTIMLKLFENANSSIYSIKLFVKCIPLFKDDDIRMIIKTLPEPYNDVTSYGKRIRVDRNKLNKELVKGLKERGVISSYKEEFDYIQINSFR
jgi:hypothetical protein